MWSGCPDAHRSICWKLLLVRNSAHQNKLSTPAFLTFKAFEQGYVPPNTDRREEVLARKRREYHNWISQHYAIDDSERSEDELAIMHQIEIDVPRTAALVELFQKPEIQRCGATGVRRLNVL